MKTNIKHKKSFREKVTIIICVVALIVVLMGVGLGYFVGLKIQRAVIGDDYLEMTGILETYIKDLIEREIEHVYTYSNSSLWKKQIINCNLKYAGMDEKGVKEYFDRMEKEWINATEESCLAKEYLTDNYLSVRLKEIAKDEEPIGEIFVTDQFGGLAASSNKTSRFYYGNEDWWQKAYNSGSGDVSLGDIEFYEGSKTWIMPLAIPIRDNNGKIIGVIKAAIDTTVFFKVLGEFHIGRTGHAALINENGQVIFHKDAVPLCQYIGPPERLKEFLKSDRGFSVFKKMHFHKEDQFIAFSKISSPLFLENGINWYALVSQASTEVFFPISMLSLYSLLLMLVLIITMIPMGMFFAAPLIKPIEKLHKAAREIVKGNWNYKIEIQTGDEIEEFARVFEEMIDSIKNKQKDLIEANTKLEEFSKGLEEKIAGRTADLLQAQSAMLDMLKDLTDSKCKLEAALKIKSDFTATISHELRTPLAAVKEGITAVADGIAGDLNAEQKELLNIAKRNVDRLARLIDGILDFQKLESGKTVFDVVKGDIKEIIMEVTNTMKPLAKAKGLELVVDLEGNLPDIRFDRDRITQVLDNVVSNAVKFTNQGVITISARKKDDFIYVAVRDTGIGIKEKDMPKLFTCFEQLEKGIGKRRGGTGLGLVISKEIVESHKGRIWAESEFGKGTTFYFTLPVNLLT